MGGTTAKASLIENGEVTRAAEYQVGAGIVLGSRLLSGAGYTLKVPAIDLAEVGAGGGSHSVDRRRRRLAGRAARAPARRPGRCATARAATEPTVTDANVVLGYLNPAQLARRRRKARRRESAGGDGREDRAAARHERRGGGATARI